SRDVVADPLDLGERQSRAARSFVGQRLKALPPGAHQRILRNHEERVHEDQESREDDEQRPQRRRGLDRLWTGAVAPSIRALLLRGGSSSFIYGDSRNRSIRLSDD